MTERKKTIIGVTLFCIFLCMCIVGFFGEEAALVFIKAKNICLECIGIG